VRFYWIN